MSEASRPVAYRDLADGLRARLRAGEWSDGSPLPTELELSRDHGLSRQTVRRAMQELVNDGSVYRVAGRGTFAVTDEQGYLRHVGSVEDLMGLSQDTELEVLTPLRRHADEVAADALGIPAADVSSFTYLRRHGDEPFVLATFSVPPDVADVLADVEALTRRGGRMEQTVIGVLDERRPGTIAEAEQTVTASLAPLDAQVHLGAVPGQAVLRVERVYRDADGRAVVHASSCFLPEQYAYRVTLRRRG